MADRLEALGARIDRAEGWVEHWREEGRNTSAYDENLTAARELREQAVVEWNDGEYDEAASSINSAHDHLDNIPPRGPPEDGGIPGWVWILILLLIAAAAIGGYVYYEQQEGRRP